MTRLFTTLALVFLVAILAQAAPQKTNNNKTSTAKTDSQVVVVHLTNALTFKPQKVTIHVGDTVKWINSAFAVHTVTANPDKAKDKKDVHLPKGAKPFGSGSLQPGATYSHTFKAAGKYKYFCIPHEMAGMIGYVTVEKNGAQSAGLSGASDTTNSTAAASTNSASSINSNNSADSETSSSPPFVLGAHAPPRPPHYRQATGIAKFLYWLGNFHPPSTDLPIGFILAGFLSEILLIITKKDVFYYITRYCVWIGGLAAIVVAGLGWCFAGVTFYDHAPLLLTHRILGSITGIWCLLLILPMEKSLRNKCGKCRWGFRAALLIAALLIIATGFFGGAMIYGTHHYAWITTAS